MTKTWREVKARKEELDHAAGRDGEAVRAAAMNRTALHVLGHRLGELRERTDLTQQDVADRMDVTQPRVSKIEQGDPELMSVETIRRYVAALGGHLRVVADFDVPAQGNPNTEAEIETDTLFNI